ncbi:hypothetical protein EYS09_13935 [Streptomyces kasugaensis]|uniref:Uncharacterized protein n=1 Tax=Streptomyces kasugaensis TaxID=1946 RepID=A0A4Q9HVB5_STRKA|nr:hypothetical protein [Streptomyces kasugaensis]TBO59106.1 hypothetical protein EYS09_13935 [Streptomyces kasugaensis]
MPSLSPITEQGSLVDGTAFGTPGQQVWVIQFPPDNRPRTFYRIAINPPTGIPPNTTLELRNDSVMISGAPSATTREFEPYHKVTIPPGTRLYLVWLTDAGTHPPVATLFTELEGLI